MMNLDFTLSGAAAVSHKLAELSAGTLTMTASSLDTLKVFGEKVFKKVHIHGGEQSLNAELVKHLYFMLGEDGTLSVSQVGKSAEVESWMKATGFTSVAR
jgi:hypothetical protein